MISITHSIPMCNSVHYRPLPSYKSARGPDLIRATPIPRRTREEQSEIDVTSGFYVLFGSGLILSFVLAIYILQSSREKIARFVRETVAENSMPMGEVAKVE